MAYRSRIRVGSRVRYEHRTGQYMTGRVVRIEGDSVEVRWDHGETLWNDMVELETV